MTGRLGERHPRAKLTDAQTRQLIDDRKVLSLEECHEKYGISVTQISRITNGHSRRSAE